MELNSYFSTVHAELVDRMRLSLLHTVEMVPEPTNEHFEPIVLSTSATTGF